MKLIKKDFEETQADTLNSRDTDEALESLHLEFGNDLDDRELSSQINYQIFICFEKEVVIDFFKVDKEDHEIINHLVEIIQRDKVDT